MEERRERVLTPSAGAATYRGALRANSRDHGKAGVSQHLNRFTQDVNHAVILAISPIVPTFQIYSVVSFLPRDAMLAMYVPWPCVSVCVCLCHKSGFVETVKRVELIFGM